MKKILLAGGGTAGHIAPNLALLPYLKNFEVHYAGQAGGMEEEMLKSFCGVTFHPITCVKLTRSFTLKNAAIPFKLLKGIRESKKLLKELSPAVVFSKGGFAALPVMLACGKNTPLIMHESDYSMGLSNRMAVKKCKTVCCTFESVAQKYPNAVYTGTPLRQELYYGSKAKAENESGLVNNGKPNLLIMGGSQGAGAINDVIFSSVNELCAYFNVVHLVGKKNECKKKHNGYYQMPFCSNMADYYAWADFCLSRGGANALCEIVSLKRPSLIIPLPKGNSRGDQVFNAEYYREKGCVRVLQQESLTAGTLLSELTALVKEKQAVVDAMVKAPSPDGTRKIANLLNAFN